MASFEFFNKRGRDQENDERNEKLHGGERRKLRCFNIGLIECLDCAVSFIQSSTTFTATANSPGHSDRNSAYRCF